jgi:SAM-dependent methyltransferase
MSHAARTKYDAERVGRYARRSPAREAAEARLLGRMLDRMAPAADALDVPCGTGRVAALLLDRGIPTRCADLSPAMRAEAERRLAGRQGFRGVVALDLEVPGPDPTLAADLVVCFRFLPHLPDAAARARVLEVLRALTRRDLLLSFHHPVSLHNLTRKARRLVGRPPSDRHAIWPGDLRREAGAAGLSWRGAVAQRRWARDLWLAWFS